MRNIKVNTSIVHSFKAKKVNVSKFEKLMEPVEAEIVVHDEFGDIKRDYVNVRWQTESTTVPTLDFIDELNRALKVNDVPTGMEVYVTVIATMLHKYTNENEFVFTIS